MTERDRLDRLAASLEPDSLAAERWFGGKDRRPTRVELVDGIAAADGALAIVDVLFEGGPPERYSVPDGAGAWRSLLPRLRSGAHGVEGGVFRPDGAVPDPLPGPERPIGADQSNTSVRLGDELLVKCYRRLWPGPHPEVELVGYLGERLACVPRGHASVAYIDRAGTEYAVALVEELVPDARDGWAWGRELFESPDAWREDDGWGGPLGRVTATLHVALADALGAREATGADAEAWRNRAERELEAALALPPGAAAGIGAWASRIERELAGLAPAPGGRVSRIHGDLHVGQVLQSPAGLFLIDFEGEPTRPPGERRALDSPMRDVASMLRSFAHAPRWVLRDRPAELPAALERAAEERERFLHAYREEIAGSAVSLDPALLRAFEVEKATYEIVYAAAFLPEWTPIAAGAMDALLAE